MFSVLNPVKVHGHNNVFPYSETVDSILVIYNSHQLYL